MSRGRPARAGRPQPRQSGWIRLWGVAVAVVTCVEGIWGGFPDPPEGGAWLESRAPLIFVGAGLLALALLAAAQARWSGNRPRESASRGRSGFGDFPAWFKYAAFGLLIAGSLLYAYAAFRSSSGDAWVLALQRRTALLLLIGSWFFVEIISWLSYRRRRHVASREDDGDATRWSAATTAAARTSTATSSTARRPSP